MTLVEAVINLAYNGNGSKGNYSDSLQIIEDGEVKINQEPCTDPNRELNSGEIVEWQSIIYGALQYTVP